MTISTTTKLHQTDSGRWVPCTASQRACPRGNHVTISGDQKAAAEFFNAVGVKTEPKGTKATGSRKASVKDIENILRSTFKGVAVAKRTALAMDLWDELQYGTDNVLTQAAYREVYGKVANQIAHVYERENTKGDHNVAARRIFLANGWLTTYVSPIGKPKWGDHGFRVVDERVAEQVGIAANHLREGQILLLGGTRYELLNVRHAPKRMVGRRVTGGEILSAELNPAYTDHSPHTTQPFWIDIDANREYALLAQPDPFAVDSSSISQTKDAIAWS